MNLARHGCYLKRVCFVYSGVKETTSEKSLKMDKSPRSWTSQCIEKSRRELQAPDIRPPGPDIRPLGVQLQKAACSRSYRARTSGQGPDIRPSTARTSGPGPGNPAPLSRERPRLDCPSPDIRAPAPDIRRPVKSRTSGPPPGRPAPELPARIPRAEAHVPIRPVDYIYSSPHPV